MHVYLNRLSTQTHNRQYFYDAVLFCIRFFWVNFEMCYAWYLHQNQRFENWWSKKQFRIFRKLVRFSIYDKNRFDAKKIPSSYECVFENAKYIFLFVIILLTKCVSMIVCAYKPSTSIRIHNNCGSLTHKSSLHKKLLYFLSKYSK